MSRITNLWTCRAMALIAVLCLLALLILALNVQLVAASPPADNAPQAPRAYQNLFEYHMCHAQDANWCPGGTGFRADLFAAMFADPTKGADVAYRWWDAGAEPPGWKLHYRDDSSGVSDRYTVDLCEAGVADAGKCPSAGNQDVIACTDGTRPVFYVEPGQGADDEKWIFKIQGGGADCHEDCSDLIIKNKYLGDFSSAYNENPTTKSPTGFFGNSPYNTFRNYNVVMLDKCVGDRNMGANTVPDYVMDGSTVISDGTGPVYFHGYRIILAVLNQLQLDHDLDDAEQILFVTQSNGSNGAMIYIDRVATHVSDTLGISAPVHLLANSFMAPNPEIEYYFETDGWPANYFDIPISTTTAPGHIDAPGTPNLEACGPGYDPQDPNKRSFYTWVLEGRTTTGAVQCDRSSPYDAFGGVDGRKYSTGDYADGFEAGYFEMWGADHGYTQSWDETCLAAHAGDPDKRACRDSRHVMTHHLQTPVFFATQIADRNLRALSRIVSRWTPYGVVWWPNDFRERVEKQAEVLAGLEGPSLCADAGQGAHGFFVDNTVDHMGVVELSKLTRKMKANAGDGAGLYFQMQHYLAYWLDPVLSPTVQCLDSGDPYDAEWTPAAAVNHWPEGVRCKSGYYSGGTQLLQDCDDPGFAPGADAGLNQADARFVCSGPSPTVCTTGGCPYTSIQAAINGSAEGSTIILAPETFTESFTISKSLTIQGAGASSTGAQIQAGGATILQAAASPGVASTRVITVSEGVTVTLEGVTVRYGYAPGSGDEGNGGGILNQGALTLTHSTVYSNEANFYGGGICNDGYSRQATLNLVSTEVFSNVATHGAGIYNDAYTANGEAVLTLLDSRVAANTSSSTGGGIYNVATSSGRATLEAIGSALEGNVAGSGSGGGLYHSSSSGTSQAAFSGATISGNSSADRGGGIATNSTNEAYVGLDIDESTISGNWSGQGGGLSNNGVETTTVEVTITHSILYSNRATGSAFPHGGAISSGGLAPATITLVLLNSTVSSNTADYDVAGIYNNGTETLTPTLIIKNSTIASNTVPPAGNRVGGISNRQGRLELSGTILAYSGDDKDCKDFQGDIVSLGPNLVEDDASCGLAAPDDDPLLGKAQDNGGPTWTQALGAGSPALDEILAGSCGAVTDQRGIARPQGDGCDIGAYEAIVDAWVDDDWTDQGDVDAFDPSLSWGADAFDNVNDAVDAVIGSTVHVRAGTYTETLDLTKSVDIIGEDGPQVTFVQAAGSRAASASRVVTVANGISVTLEGLTLRYGAAAAGGGIRNMGALTVANTIVYSNGAATKGGGIYSAGALDTRLVVVDSTVWDNLSWQDGGGIYNGGLAGPAYLTIEGSTLAANDATGGTGVGGGLVNNGAAPSSPAYASVENSTVSGNSAFGGGGIANSGAHGRLLLRASTLSDNTAAAAGALGNPAGVVTMTASILANSIGAADCGNSGIVVDDGDNLVEDPGNCGFAPGSDPFVGQLADNGGKTRTHALLGGSPALDAIASGSCPVAVDQRGIDRPRGDGCDVGSFEAITEAWVDDDWTGQGDVDNYDPALTWGVDAFATVGEGVAAVSGSTVHVLGGTYTETLTLDKSVDIIGEDGAASTFVQAAGHIGLAASRVITVTPGVTVTIEGLTIRHGNATGGGSDDGGGIYNRGRLALTETVIISNTADDDGGGIASRAWAGEAVVLSLSGCTVAGNDAISKGGGLYGRADDGGTTTVTIDYSTIHDNEASDEGDGGGLAFRALSGTVTVDLIQSIVSDNTADEDGGGIQARGTYTNGLMLLNVISSTISGNTAEGEGGGGIFVGANNYGTARMAIAGSTLSANTAEDWGKGGGILAFTDPHGDLDIDISNSTFSSNTVDYRGGALYSEEDDDGTNAITLTHSTFWANSGPDAGGGLYVVDGTLHLASNIIAGSTGGDCVSNSALLTDAGYNLVEDGSCISAGTSLAADPRLGPLQENDGRRAGATGEPVDTHYPQPGSPAIDTIPVAVCSAPADQRGYARPYGLGCDSGAVEVDRFSWTITKTVDQANAEMGQTVTFTIVVSNSGPGLDGVIVSDTLPAGLNFLGPVSLSPAAAGTVGTQPPTLASDVVLSTGTRVTVTFPVTVAYGLGEDSVLTNIASARKLGLSPITSTAAVGVGNVPPVAVDDGGAGFETDEDTALTTGSVLANDYDDNGDTLSVAAYGTAGSLGLVANLGDGTFSYDPDDQFEDLAAGQWATDTFTYTVTDGRGGADWATVTITVTGVDDTIEPIDYEVFLPVVLRND